MPILTWINFLWLQIFILKNHFLNDVNRILWTHRKMSLNADSHIFWNFVQQNKFAINHNLRLWVCFVVGITTNIMLYLISRARKFLALFASFSLLVISFVVFSQGKDAMGPTRHNTQQRYHEEGTWRKLLKNYPNFLSNLFDSSHVPSLVINTPYYWQII